MGVRGSMVGLPKKVRRTTENRENYHTSWLTSEYGNKTKKGGGAHIDLLEEGYHSVWYLILTTTATFLWSTCTGTIAVPSQHFPERSAQRKRDLEESLLV